MQEILEAFQDRNVEFIFDGMKSRRISIPEPQTWTGFVLRNVAQTKSISFCEMVKKLFQHRFTSILFASLSYLVVWSMWVEVESGNAFSLPYDSLKTSTATTEHSTVMQPLWSHFGIKQEWWDGADTCAGGLIREEALMAMSTSSSWENCSCEK